MNKYLIGFIVALLLVWLLREGCNYFSGKKKNTEIARLKTELAKKPIIKYDTIRPTADTHYIPRPYAVPGRDIPYPVPEYHEVKVNNFDSAYFYYLVRVKEDYFKSFRYRDSTEVPGLGYFGYDDTVRQNRIASREPFFQLYKPNYIIHDTIVQKVNRGRVFIGPEFYGYKAQPFNGAGLGIDWATKGNKEWSAATYYDNTLKAFVYKAGVKFYIK